MRAPLVVIGLAFLFVGGIVLAIGGGTVIEEWTYDVHGIRAEAVAVGRSLRFATDTSDTAYELSYSVSLKGTVHRRTDHVPVHIWERTEPGTRFAVEYLPGRLASVRVARNGWRDDAPAIIWTAVGTILVLGALTAFTAAVRIKIADPAPDDVPSSTDPDHLEHALSSRHPTWRSSDLWLGAIFLIVGTPALIGTAFNTRHDWYFLSKAIPTEGVVLTKEIKRSGKGQRTRTYEATYRFAAGDASYESRTRLTFEGWSQLKERESAPVLYLAARPSISRLDRPRPWDSTAAFAIAGSIFSGIGGVFVVRAIRRSRVCPPVHS